MRLPSWAETEFGTSSGILRDEIDADALRAHEAGDLLDALQERLRRVVEQEMRLVEEEDELGLGRIADLGQRLPELGQHPEQERRVEPRLLHELVGDEDADDAAPVGSRAHEVLDVEGGLAEKLLGSLLLEHEQAALDRGDRGCSHVAVLGHELLRALGDRGDERAQIVEVYDRQLIVLGDAERDVQDALLHLVELEHAREQKRSHVLDRRPHRVALFAEHVPEDRRIGPLFPVAAEPDLLGALHEKVLSLADGGDAREVALDVGGEHRHTRGREAFGEHLQRHRLAGAGRAGDETVPIGKLEIEVLGLHTLAEEDLSVLHHRLRHDLLRDCRLDRRPTRAIRSAAVITCADLRCKRQLHGRQREHSAILQRG